MKFDYNLLVNTLSIQSESYKSHLMERYIKRFLKKNNIPYHLDAYGNIYATKGHSNLYPTMVCHVDTVHEINMNSIVKRHGDILYSIDSQSFQRTGIGGDDKVGVFITLSCLLHFDNFKAVFFKDEEIGCVGSSHADFKFFDDSTLVLQCDRKGMGDFVTSIYNVSLCNDDLLLRIDDILDAYHRKPVDGGLTDVKQIALNNDVQVANVNCGYYSPHTDDEFVSITDVKDTLYFCAEVFVSTLYNRFTMKRDVYKYDYSYGYGWDPYPYKPLTSSSHATTYNATECPGCTGSDTMYDPYTNGTYCFTCDDYYYEEIKQDTKATN